MATQIETAQREIVVVEDAHIRPMMGNQVLESLPSRHIPYSLVDPYILVHEAVVRIDPNQETQDTTHPHRGSTTSGTRSRGHRAPATAPVPARRSSAPGWARGRSATSDP